MGLFGKFRNYRARKKLKQRTIMIIADKCPEAIPYLSGEDLSKACALVQSMRDFTVGTETFTETYTAREQLFDPTSTGPIPMGAEEAEKYFGDVTHTHTVTRVIITAEGETKAEPGT